MYVSMYVYVMYVELYTSRNQNIELYKSHVYIYIYFFIGYSDIYYVEVEILICVFGALTVPCILQNNLSPWLKDKANPLYLGVPEC